MIRIAIVDDEENVLDILKCKISEILDEMDAEADLFCCQIGDALIRLHNEMDFNIIFLDLEMPQSDGLETAKAIRNDDPNVVLVFVTNREDLVFNAFQYNAIAFVRKKRLDKELAEAVEQAYRKAIAKLSVHFLKTENGDICFKSDEILYFSSQGHNVWLHHKSGKSYRVFYTLEQLENIVSSESFVRCHSGILVNCGYIFSIDKENVILTNGEAVALSRHRKKKVKEVLQKYLRSL
ncbi:MAG: LytR/AlgR family response regulator transcription factor [Oscillospiraceae bacterium]